MLFPLERIISAYQCQFLIFFRGAPTAAYPFDREKMRPQLETISRWELGIPCFLYLFLFLFIISVYVRIDVFVSWYLHVYMSIYLASFSCLFVCVNMVCMRVFIHISKIIDVCKCVGVCGSFFSFFFSLAIRLRGSLFSCLCLFIFFLKKGEIYSLFMRKHRKRWCDKNFMKAKKNGKVFLVYFSKSLNTKIIFWRFPFVSATFNSFYAPAVLILPGTAARQAMAA